MKGTVALALLLSPYMGGCEPRTGRDDCGDLDWPSNTQGPDPIVSAPDEATRSVEIDDNTVVTMQRDGCFGPCPVYSVRVGGDGTVEFSGERYVHVVGEATGQIPVADVQRLVGSMLGVDFFSLESDGACGPDDCRWIVLDTSVVTISLTLGDRAKTIGSVHGDPCAPRVLRPLEDLIDEIARTAPWVKCDTPSGVCLDPEASREPGALTTSDSADAGADAASSSR